jgi:hypothetical protein
MMEDFSYDAMSEEQAQQERYSMLKEGIYDATVEKFEGKISSSGNRMIEFLLHVYEHDGKVVQMKDFIAFTPKMTWKLRHHCVSGGMEEEFTNKTWRPHLSVGKMFRVKIAVQKGQEIPQDKLKGKPLGSVYPDRNVIDDYVADGNVKSSPASNGESKEFHDDVPW